MSKHDPTNLFFMIAIIMIAILSGLLWKIHINPLYAFLVGMSVITFMFYGYDKRQSRRNKMRVPEIILHMLALLGGTPGAFLGQLFFRHKTKKLRFKIVFLAIVLLQILFGFYYWRYRR